jgi:hypothetical protein
MTADHRVNPFLGGPQPSEVALSSHDRSGSRVVVTVRRKRVRNVQQSPKRLSKARGALLVEGADGYHFSASMHFTSLPANSYWWVL